MVRVTYRVVIGKVILMRLWRFVVLMMVSVYVLMTEVFYIRYAMDIRYVHLSVIGRVEYLNSNSPLLLSSPYSKTGGRLCTGEEILDRCTAATGCSLNKALVWACTASNTNSCSESAECCSGLCNASGVCEDVINGPDTSSPSTSPSTSPTKGPTNVVSCFVFVSSTSQLSRV